jgi:hypothetical protein
MKRESAKYRCGTPPYPRLIFYAQLAEPFKDGSAYKSIEVLQHRDQNVFVFMGARGMLPSRVQQFVLQFDRTIIKIVGSWNEGRRCVMEDNEDVGSPSAMINHDNWST